MSDASILSSQFVWTWRLELSDKTSLHPAREQAIAAAAAVGISTGTLEGSFLVPPAAAAVSLKATRWRQRTAGRLAGDTGHQARISTNRVWKRLFSVGLAVLCIVGR